MAGQVGLENVTIGSLAKDMGMSKKRAVRPFPVQGKPSARNPALCGGSFHPERGGPGHPRGVRGRPDPKAGGKLYPLGDAPDRGVHFRQRRHRVCRPPRQVQRRAPAPAERMGRKPRQDRRLGREDRRIRSRHRHRAVCFRPVFASARLPLLPADAGRRKSPQTPGGRPFRIWIGSDTVQGWQWGRGPAVLFVHGWNNRAGHFAPLVGPLLDAGFSVAADTPRHGPSSGRTSSYFQFTDAVRALLRTGSGTRLHGLVGHSTGRRY